jgi:hypothetical protein
VGGVKAIMKFLKFPLFNKKNIDGTNKKSRKLSASKNKLSKLTHPSNWQCRSIFIRITVVAGFRSCIMLQTAKNASRHIKFEFTMVGGDARNLHLSLRCLDSVQVDWHAKITDLADAIVIEQNISCRQVSMDNLDNCKAIMDYDLQLSFTKLKKKNFPQTFFSAMYSMPRAISSAKPVKRRGESGITGCREEGGWCKPLKTPRAALRRDKRRPVWINVTWKWSLIEIIK